MNKQIIKKQSYNTKQKRSKTAKNTKKTNNRKKTEEMISTEEFETTQEMDTSTTTTTIVTTDNDTQVNISTPSQKRLRDVLHNSALGNVCKTPRLTNNESSLKFITIMDKRLDRLTEKLELMIKDKFNECKEYLLDEFDKRLNSITTNVDTLLQSVTTDLKNIQSRVKQLETVVQENIELKNETDLLKNEICNLKVYVQKQENSIVASDIRVNGIPSNNKYKDNLFVIYEKICEAVNIQPIAVKTIYRIKNTRSKKNIDDAPIIIKFCSPYERNYILKMITTYMKANKNLLRLNQIGIESTVPFYINENLTPENHRIFLEARKMKKDNKISAAFVNRGLVYIKKLGCDDHLQINTIETLKELFRFQNNDDENVYSTELQGSSDDAA